MKNITKLLLPYFPDNDWLLKHWWHRFAKVCALILSILLNLIALACLIQTATDFIPCTTTQKITIEELGRRAKMKLDTYQVPVENPKTESNGFLPLTEPLNVDKYSNRDAGDIVLEAYPVYKDMIIGYNCLEKISPFLIEIMLASSVLGLFSVSLVYRLILYIALVDGWNK